MVLAVADENRTGGIDIDTVRPRQPALERVAVWPVAFLARASDQFQRTLANIDHADAVALGVSQINIAIGCDADAFGTRQRGLLRGPAVAGESLLSGAGDVLNGPFLQIHFIHRVSF